VAGAVLRRSVHARAHGCMHAGMRARMHALTNWRLLPLLPQYIKDILSQLVSRS
jgi:hypothetical protein